MKHKLLCLISLIVLCTSYVSAKEVYCSVVEYSDGKVEIKPNREYLTDMYWQYILYDNDKGTKRKFGNIEEAVTLLNTFGWYVVKYELLGKQVTCIMGHEVNNYQDLKSSRELMNKIFT